MAARNVTLMARITADATQFTTAMRTTGLSAQQTSGLMSSSFKTSASLVAGYAAYMGVQLVGEFAKIEREWVDVTTLLPQYTETMTDKMFGNVRDFAKRTDNTIQESITSTYKAVSALFVTPKEQIDLLKASDTLSKSIKTDLSTATNLIISSLNAFGLESSDTALIVDTLTTAIRFGVTTGEEFAQAMGKTLQPARTLGISLKDLTAVNAALTNAGQSQAEAATNQRRAIVEMLRPQSKVNEAYKEFYGTTIPEAIKAGASYGDIWRDMGHMMRETGRNAFELFGRVQGAQAAAVLTTVDGYAVYNQALQDFTGAGEVAANKVRATLQHEIDLMKASFQELKLSLVEGFEVPIKFALKGLGAGFDVAGYGADTLKDMFSAAPLWDEDASNASRVLMGSMTMGLSEVGRKVGWLTGLLDNNSDSWEKNAGSVDTSALSYDYHYDSVIRSRNAQNEIKEAVDTSALSYDFYYDQVIRARDANNELAESNKYLGRSYLASTAAASVMGQTMLAYEQGDWLMFAGYNTQEQINRAAWDFLHSGSIGATLPSSSDGEDDDPTDDIDKAFRGELGSLQTGYRLEMRRAGHTETLLDDLEQMYLFHERGRGLVDRFGGVNDITRGFHNELLLFMESIKEAERQQREAESKAEKEAQEALAKAIAEGVAEAWAREDFQYRMGEISAEAYLNILRKRAETEGGRETREGRSVLLQIQSLVDKIERDADKNKKDEPLKKIKEAIDKQTEIIVEEHTKDREVNREINPIWDPSVLHGEGVEFAVQQQSDYTSGGRRPQIPVRQNG